MRRRRRCTTKRAASLADVYLLLNRSLFESRSVAGTEDCENTTRLIESLMATLKTMRCEMQAEVFRSQTISLRVLQITRTWMTSLSEKEAPTSELQLIGALREVLKGNQLGLLLRKCITASIPNRLIYGEDENTVTFLEPVHVLTFQDTTMDDTEEIKTTWIK
uniref:Uncharacterized protein n=1 Tax=Wuchereria bancrofti TaxID=6293 RepID=A0A1I8EVX7_WUCBA